MNMKMQWTVTAKMINGNQITKSATELCMKI